MSITEPWIKLNLYGKACCLFRIVWNEKASREKKEQLYILTGYLMWNTNWTRRCNVKWREKNQNAPKIHRKEFKIQIAFYGRVSCKFTVQTVFWWNTISFSESNGTLAHTRNAEQPTQCLSGGRCIQETAAIFFLNIY